MNPEKVIKQLIDNGIDPDKWLNDASLCFKKIKNENKAKEFIKSFVDLSKAIYCFSRMGKPIHQSSSGTKFIFNNLLSLKQTAPFINCIDNSKFKNLYKCDAEEIKFIHQCYNEILEISKESVNFDDRYAFKCHNPIDYSQFRWTYHTVIGNFNIYYSNEKESSIGASTIIAVDRVNSVFILFNFYNHTGVVVSNNNLTYLCPHYMSQGEHLSLSTLNKECNEEEVKFLRSQLMNLRSTESYIILEQSENLFATGFSLDENTPSPTWHSSIFNMNSDSVRMILSNNPSNISPFFIQSIGIKKGKINYVSLQSKNNTSLSDTIITSPSIGTLFRHIKHEDIPTSSCYRSNDHDMIKELIKRTAQDEIIDSPSSKGTTRGIMSTTDKELRSIINRHLN